MSTWWNDNRKGLLVAAGVFAGLVALAGDRIGGGVAA